MDKKKRDEVFYDFYVKSNTHLSPVKYDAIGVTIGSWEMYKYMIRKNIDLVLYEKYCQVGLTAPNPDVIEVSGKISKPIMKHRKLLSFSNSIRPLVVNFGSCTWPPFMAQVEPFIKLVNKYSSIVDFITIYISEAHATNQWNFSTNPFKVRAHRSLDERIMATFLLRKEFEKYGWKESLMKIAADPMNNQARKMYTALPERFGVIIDGKIEFLSGIGSEHYLVSKLENWLENYQQSIKK